VKRKYPQYTHGFIDRSGTPRFYLRMPGRKRVPLPGLPWSPQFMAAREQAMAGDEWRAPPIGSTATVAGTVNAALIAYYESGVWQALNESTRPARRSVLEKFRSEHGDKRMALMHARALAAILDKKTPAPQRNFSRAIRGLVNFAIDRGLIETDPFAAVRLAKQKKKGEFDGIIPWMPEECAQFEAHFQLGTRERLGYELLLQAG
jgi:hypothetical protein